MAAHNIAEFDKGIAKFKQAMSQQMEEVCRQMMWDVLVDAIGNYTSSPHVGGDGNDLYLTGNTINAFGCGFYERGKLVQYIIAKNVGVAPPTADFAYVGKTDYYEYHMGKMGGEHIHPKDVGSRWTYQYGERTGLKFVPVSHKGTGDEAAIQFLKDFKNVRQNEYAIVVCNAVPYAGYLREKRLFDILTTTHINTEHLAVKVLKSIKKL